MYLKKWHDAHPEARPLHAALFGFVEPRLAGIAFVLPPKGPSIPRKVPPSDSGIVDDDYWGPLPGWYAIDVNFLRGTHVPTPDGKGNWQGIPSSGLNYEYFRRFKPIAMAGYSIHIYKITVEDANLVRQTLGLSMLSMDVSEKVSAPALYDRSTP
jgi:hypothetical protein